MEPPDFLCVIQNLPRVNTVDYPGTEKVRVYSTHPVILLPGDPMDFLILLFIFPFLKSQVNGGPPIWLLVLSQWK